ncbi:MAG: hypothetical protein ACQEXQ_21650 [Bacillota bacterium]
MNNSVTVIGLGMLGSHTRTRFPEGRQIDDRLEPFREQGQRSCRLWINTRCLGLRGNIVDCKCD